MLGSYDEVLEMAMKLKMPVKPTWYDKYGCPHWGAPSENLERFVKPIRCQLCGQTFNVCLVDDVYRSYGRRSEYYGPGKLPKHWAYGDPPAHPSSDKWDGKWWESGWDAVCTGVTMTSISEWEFECWDFEKGDMPRYRDEELAEDERKDD